MDINDSVKLMAMIKANYPAYHAKTDEATQKAAARIMAAVLGDLCPEDCEMALMQYMSEPREFPPNAGQIREIAARLRSPFCGAFMKMAPIVQRYSDRVAKKAGGLAMLGAKNYLGRDIF